nr:hypothetical protein [Tanacetum cinerariifolium]
IDKQAVRVEVTSGQEPKMELFPRPQQFGEDSRSLGLRGITWNESFGPFDFGNSMAWMVSDGEPTFVSIIALFTGEIERRVLKKEKRKRLKKGTRNMNSCPLCERTDHNKRTCTGMFKDQDEVVVAQDKVVQEKIDLVENEEELI